MKENQEFKILSEKQKSKSSTMKRGDSNSNKKWVNKFKSKK